MVRDRLTGLQWLEDANPFEWPLSWHEAGEQVARLAHEGFGGHHDWRLPNRRELRSLVSHESSNPALPQGHPFHGIFLGWYWSSTTSAFDPAWAMVLHLDRGAVGVGIKRDPRFALWPVAS